MWMLPKDFAIGRCHAHYVICQSDNKLILPVYVNDNRGGRRKLEVILLPCYCAGSLVECHEGLSRSTHRHNNQILVCQWAARIASTHACSVVLFIKIVRPDHSAGLLVECMHL